MARTSKKISSYKLKKLKAQEAPCHCCGKEDLFFAYRCRCGFTICQDCMDENVWGMTCNGITWECPDCSEQNGFGNQ